MSVETFSDINKIFGKELGNTKDSIFIAMIVSIIGSFVFKFVQLDMVNLVVIPFTVGITVTIFAVGYTLREQKSFTNKFPEDIITSLLSLAIILLSSLGV